LWAFAEPPAIDDAAELLAAAPLYAIDYGFLSSSDVLGINGDQALKARLQKWTAYGVPTGEPAAEKSQNRPPAQFLPKQPGRMVPGQVHPSDKHIRFTLGAYLS
jgi:hypothetical protein